MPNSQKHEYHDATLSYTHRMMHSQSRPILQYIPQINCYFQHSVSLGIKYKHSFQGQLSPYCLSLHFPLTSSDITSRSSHTYTFIKIFLRHLLYIQTLVRVCRLQITQTYNISAPHGQGKSAEPRGTFLVSLSIP